MRDRNANQYQYVIEPYQTAEFPMHLMKEGCHIITYIKKNSLLFKEKNKINISLEINKRVFEYGINRVEVYERYINYSAFYADMIGQKVTENC